jgi:hypothetical protein
MTSKQSKPSSPSSTKLSPEKLAERQSILEKVEANRKAGRHPEPRKPATPRAGNRNG